MGFLRRLLGGSDRSEPAWGDGPTPTTADAAAGLDGGADADERRRELEVLREDQERLDELTRRQLRYADYAWQPPAEGGEQRAEDRDAGREAG